MFPALFISAGLGLAIALLLIFPMVRSDWAQVGLSRPADWHHTHAGSVPRLGGLVLAIAFITIEVYIGAFHPELRTSTPGRDVIVLGSLAMFALGFWDDLRPLAAGWKLLGQVVIAGAVCAGGVAIEFCKVPLAAAPVCLGAWGPLFTVLWLVGLTNLINLIDGMDGLAGGICLMLMLLTACAGHSNGHFELLASGMAGALVGFLRYNFPPARIYLGDGGAYFLGFQVGLYSIVNSRQGSLSTVLAAPLLVLALPLTDAGLTLARRGLRGLPLFRPDRKHLHHRFLAGGGSPRQVVVRLYGLNLLFLVLGLAALWAGIDALPLLLGAGAIVLLGCARSFGFSPRWFAVQRVVRACWRMRGQVQYALCLARWLELEGRRRSGPQELWPDLVFAADKLGFNSVTYTQRGEQRVWQRHDGTRHGMAFRYDCVKGRFGCLEFLAPECPDRARLRGGPLDCDVRCRRSVGNCLADPRIAETASELLAEAWNRSALGWNARRVAPRANRGSAATGVAACANGFIQFMKRMVTLWCMGLLGLSWAMAEPLAVTDFRPVLRRIPAAELPAAAAEWVRQASENDRLPILTNVVKAAIEINPAATPLIVSAVVRAAPGLTALTARIAAVEQPAQCEAITRAAVGTVQAKAGETVAAVCGVLPAAYRNVALAAGRVAPQASAGILRGVGAARPDLRPFIERQITASQPDKISIGHCLDQVELARTHGPPGLGPGVPEGTGSDKQGPATPEAAGPKPPRGNGHVPGGRNYARP